MADELKRLVADEAARMIVSGQRVGLGSGSTAGLFVAALGKRIAGGAVADVVGVPTSAATRELAWMHSVPVATLEECPRLDLTVDGADEIDPWLDLIKGQGGALMREKIVAAASERFVVIADESKLVSKLGNRAPVPVEVLPFGWRSTARSIEAIGAEVVLRTAGDDPFVTDQTNWILDCRFQQIDDAWDLACELDAIAGALAHGLFVGMTDAVMVGRNDGVETLTGRGAGGGG
jgi:ribose 5-phosphate isomerase A